MEIIPLRFIFVDHSNIWGGARLATRIQNPELPDWSARISVRNLDVVLSGRKRGVVSKIVSGGIPPGMEGVWEEYDHAGYDVQRLFKDHMNWKECGVDHTIIGHMWRLLAKHQADPIELVLASGDGSKNEFGTSFFEVLEEVCRKDLYPKWTVELCSFDWRAEALPKRVDSPTKKRMRQFIERSPKGQFVNLFDHYDKLVYHQTKKA